MNNIVVYEPAPGLEQARYVENKIHSLGIYDIKLFFDPQIRIWAVCQVEKQTSRLILPDNYTQDNIRPYILWWVKDANGTFRLPGDQDVYDLVVIRQRADKTWKQGGDWLADKLDKQSADKDQLHRERFKEKIHAIAPRMKKAIRQGRIV